MAQRRPTDRRSGGKVTGKPADIGTTPGRVARILFMTALFAGLGVLFLLIVLPKDRGAVPPPAGEITAPDSAGGADEESTDDEVMTEPGDDEIYGESEIDEEPAETAGGEEATDDVEEEVEVLDYTGVYMGAGETEFNEVRNNWDISMELSGDSYVYIDGKVGEISDPDKGTGSDLKFTILERTFEMTLSQTGKDDIVVTSQFEGGKGSIFSVNDKRQFFLYVTPKKVNINLEATLLPKEMLKAKEHTPLIDMSGFIKEDGIVVGMFHSPFVPTVEYQLERVGE